MRFGGLCSGGWILSSVRVRWFMVWRDQLIGVWWFMVQGSQSDQGVKWSMGWGFGSGRLGGP